MTLTLTTSVTMMAAFVLSMLPASLVNEMDPEATAKFPNYLYIYFMQLVDYIIKLFLLHQ
jgi:hypothetical protein